MFCIAGGCIYKFVVYALTSRPLSRTDNEAPSTPGGKYSKFLNSLLNLILN